VKPIRIILVFTLLIGLTACSSDPFRNAGSCTEPGKYKKVDGELVICTGLDGKFKFYFEGTAFDDMDLLGRAELQSLTFDSEEPFLAEAKVRGLSDLTWRTKHDISNDDISRFANGDTRWDGLIESNAKRQALEAENKIAQDYRFSMLNDYRAGKVSRALAYEAQQDQMAVVAKLDAAQAIFDQKLSVLRSEMKRLYGIQDTIEVMLFVVELQHP